jgi:molybdate-binding protein/DNA-binding transcriptional regulator YhcF (GntR family)
MLQIIVNSRAQIPIYKQITEQVKQLIANSQLKPGSRMPTVRDLSVFLQVNSATVARAYQELGQEGILGASRRRGTIVLGDTDSPQRQPLRQNRLSGTVNNLILETLSLGYTPEELEAAFSLQLARWRVQREIQEFAGIAEIGTTGPEVIRIVGSNDLALDLLISRLKYSNPEIKVQITPAGSLGGLLAIQEGKADIAGIHLLDEETGEYNNTGVVQHTLQNRQVAIVHLADRIQGLIVARGNPKNILGLKDLKRSNLTFANRQKGSGTRVWLDYKLRELGILPAVIKGYQNERDTHLAVAMSILKGEADVGLGIQASAISCNLDFIPLTKEKFGLVIPVANYHSKLFEPILKIIGSDEFKQIVNEMGGYDTTRTGATFFI